MHRAHNKTPFEVFFGRKPQGAFQAYNPALLNDEVILEDSPAEPNIATVEQQFKSVSKVWETANEALDHYREINVSN